MRRVGSWLISPLSDRSRPEQHSGLISPLSCRPRPERCSDDGVPQRLQGSRGSSQPLGPCEGHEPGCPRPSSCTGVGQGPLPAGARRARAGCAGTAATRRRPRAYKQRPPLGRGRRRCGARSAARDAPRVDSAVSPQLWEPTVRTTLLPGPHPAPRPGCSWMPLDALGCPGRPREAQGGTGMLRDALGCPGVPRDAQGCPL